MITDTTDDIFSVQAPSLILHQVNCLGYGSIGIMNRVMKTWPSLFKEYHDLCGWFKDYKHQEELLGLIQSLPIPGTNLILCNAFSQRFFSDTKYEVDFEAWEKILRKVMTQVHSNQKNTGILYEVHCPNKIGISMKPEEIETLKELVDAYFQDSDITWTYHI